MRQPSGPRVDPGPETLGISFDGHIGMPLRPLQLRKIVERVLSGAAAALALDTERRTATQHPKVPNPDLDTGVFRIVKPRLRSITGTDVSIRAV